MIDIVKSKIDTKSLNDSLEDISCGARVIFEGIVRNHNDGKEIISLYYECYYPLAIKTMNEIVESAMKKFPIKNVSTVHRIGHIPIGESAVWVGVSSIHRKEAFLACEFIINEIKHRVPIWKKETYKNGTVSWVECCKEVHC